MTKRRSSRNDRCPSCHIHYRLCFCERIIAKETKTKITLILHASELNLTSNTGKLAHALLSNSEILVRGGLEQKDEKLVISPPENYKTYFLFPDADSVELNYAFLMEEKNPIQLVVPDGSWRQAKKFKRREEALVNLPTLRLPLGEPSKYFLRTEPMENYVCTLEAIARALGVLEGPEIQKHLEDVFNIMVERTLMARSGRHHLP